MNIDRGRRTDTATGRGYALGFGLFLLLNAILFLRPTEVIASLSGVQLFEGVILSCFAVSFPAVFNQLRPQRLKGAPITCCVLGLLVAVAFSHLSHLRPREAFTESFSFFKIVVYYLLFVGLVNTPQRLRWFLLWLLACLAVVSALALLQYYEVIDNPTPAVIQDWSKDEATGDAIRVSRLQAAGIFGNPNDLARMEVIGLALAVYLFFQRRSLILAPISLALVGLFGYTLTLTQSRGGFMALAVTMLALVGSAVRGRKALILSALVLAVMFALFAGRQTDLAVDAGTGQQRIRLWAEGLAALKTAPLFGIGKGEYSGIGGGLGAHNAFVESFVELGLCGGIAFLSAFYLALRYCFRLGAAPAQMPDPNLRRVRPVLFAIGAGYAVGLMSSSRNYAMPTYTLLALACVYQRLAGVYAPRLAARLNGQLAVRLIAISLIFLVAIYLFVRITAKWQ